MLSTLAVTVGTLPPPHGDTPMLSTLAVTVGTLPPPHGDTPR